MTLAQGATTHAALPTLAGDVTVNAVGADNLRALRMAEPVEQRRLMLLVGVVPIDDTAIRIQFYELDLGLFPLAA